VLPDEAELMRQQIAFVHEATSGGDSLYARLLEAKRRREVASCLPVLTGALGADFAPRFARWWRESAHDHRDFHAAVLAAGEALAATLPTREHPAVEAELDHWRLHDSRPWVRRAGGHWWARWHRGASLLHLPRFLLP
jgi:hypothetical protein